MARLYCGTSGFAYPAWKPDFYPAKLPAKDFLNHYAQRLNSVEINYTFRQLPKSTTLDAWIQATPETFRFAVKAHQRITHINRLKPSEFTGIFFRAIDPLRATGRLGPVLFQLPPNLKFDEVLLSDFLATLPNDIQHAFEFRNASWLQETTTGLLKKAGVSLCLAESDRFEVPEVVTAQCVYVRLRKSDYTGEERREVAARCRQFLESGHDIYVYFKHEETPAGAKYAEELLKIA